MAARDIFLGRQPILDREHRIVAYELLFRSRDMLDAGVTDDMQATASVIHHAFSEMGVQTVLGSQLGFINVSGQMLLSDMIELLPGTQVVLELLETIEIDAAIIERCRVLKQKGFTLALDDFIYDDSYRPLLGMVDIIKVDIMQHHIDELPGIVNRLRSWPVQLLAEKVENAEIAERCKALGFDLFQGYFFAKPSVLTAKRAGPSQLALIQLLGLVLRDADTTQIELIFKQHPNLAYNLLRLVNSVACGVHRNITSVTQAVMVLGRTQLQRWLQLLLFTLQGSLVYPSPLLMMAATRGKMMELLAVQQHRSADYGDEAFMVGILSLIDNIIDKPLADIVAELNLGDRLSSALLAREGELGNWLKLVERVEHSDLGATQTLLGDTTTLSLADLTEIEIAAMSWANQIADAAA